MAVSEMLRYVRTLILCVLLPPHWGQTSPIPSLEEPISGGLGAVDVSLLAQDDNVDVQTLLGQFHYMLNLTERQPKPRPRAAHVEPPEYMLELYNHYTKDHSSRPAANMARSFKNEGTLSEVCFINFCICLKLYVISLKLLVDLFLSYSQ